MRIHSLFLLMATLAIGCDSSTESSRSASSSKDSESGKSGEAERGSGSGSTVEEQAAFIEVDNGFESDDPGGPGADRTRGGARLRGLVVSNASGVNSSANVSNDSAANTSAREGASDAAAARAVQEADIIKVDGDRLYALSRYGGLTIVDIANPDRMKLLGRKRTDGMPFEMYVEGGRAFVMLSDVERWVARADGVRGRRVQTSEIFAFDVSDPANVTELSRFDVPGTIADSRKVGDLAYVVTYEDGGCWGCQEKPATIVSSFALGAAVTKRDRLVYASPNRDYAAWRRSVSATNERLYIAGPEWSWAPGRAKASSIIEVVDITDPSGKLRKGADVSVAGQIESRWQMDEHAGVLRVVSQFGRGWDGDGPSRRTINPKVQTFAIESSTRITPLGSTELILPRPEQLRSVRFDGPRGYAITAARTDPLFTMDLSDPAAPRQTGELEMPGWIFHMEPRGDRLIGFGYDDTNQGSANLAVSLFDVSDLTRPAMLKRVSFGSGWGRLAEDQDRIHKSVRVLDDAGMVLVPFASEGRWDAGKCEAPQSGIQLIDYRRDDLVLRGLAPQWGMPRRAFVANGRLLAMSDRNVTSFDITSRDAPTKKHELDLSNPAYRLAELPEHVASITSDHWSGEVMLSLTPKAKADDAAVTGKLSLASLAPPSESQCWGRSGWGSWYEARLFGSGKTVYVTVPSYTQEGNVQRGKLIAAAIDVSDPRRPVIAGKTEMLFAERDLSKAGASGWYGWHGGFADGWAFWAYHGEMSSSLVGSGQAVVQHGAKLAYIETGHEATQLREKDGSWSWAVAARRRLHVVDFASPAQPKTYAIALPESLGSSPLHLYKGTVLASRWVRSVKNPGKVRFFVDRVDLNGPRPVILPSINTPGSLLLADEASDRFVTADYRVERVSLGDTPREARARAVSQYEDCSTTLGHGAVYDAERHLCIRMTRDFKLADVADTKVTLRQTMTLPAQNIAGVQIADDRIYVTRYKQYGPSRYSDVELRQDPQVLDDGGLWAIGGVRAGQLAIVSEMAGDAEWPLAAHGTKVALSTQGGLAIYDTATATPTLVARADLRGYGHSSHVLMSDTRAIASLAEWGLQTIAY